ncbi:MAG: hypothetical protein Q7U45_12610, partial [Burkholderiaceae bacterium]|nr:hypothetical protein [Burkholderiaceae bacterium]
MDDSNAPTRNVNRSSPDAPTSQGGTVEPANRAPVAIRTFQAPEPEPGERYELRDPFADLTYRSDRFQDMVAKADQLGANRFVVLDARDQRSFIHKVDGQWQREEPRDPKRDGQAFPRATSTPEPNSQPTLTNVIPLPSTLKESPVQETTDPQTT